MRVGPRSSFPLLRSRAWAAMRSCSSFRRFHGAWSPLPMPVTSGPATSWTASGPSPISRRGPNGSSTSDPAPGSLVSRSPWRGPTWKSRWPSPGKPEPPSSSWPSRRSGCPNVRVFPEPAEELASGFDVCLARGFGDAAREAGSSPGICWFREETSSIGQAGRSRATTRLLTPESRAVGEPTLESGGPIVIMTRQ